MLSKDHRLEPVVWNAFAERKGHDTSSLAYFMAGTVVRGGSRAYRKVARDILDYIESQGKLERDNFGWWRPVKS